jgi:hypothetical protein
VTEKLTSAFRCPVARNTHPKHDVALGAALAGWLETTHRATAVVVEPAPAADPVPGRPVHRRRLVRASAAGVGVAVVIAGGLIVGGRFSAGTAEAHNPGLGTAQTESRISSAESTTPVATTRSSAQAAPSSTGSTATDSPIQPQSAETSTTPTTPILSAVQPPPTFDRDTVTWFRELCGGADQINQLIVPEKKSFPSVKAAQAEYVAAYQQRATTADATAVRLGRDTWVADGRVDPAPVIDGLHQVAIILANAAQSVQDLNPPTADGIAAQVNETELRVKLQTPANLARLSEQEQAFVYSLPGCVPAAR